jgi:hypothetical protein
MDIELQFAGELESPFVVEADGTLCHNVLFQVRSSGRRNKLHAIDHHKAIGAFV